MRNFEFKARTDKIENLEKKLIELNPVFIGVDHQKDTYFNSEKGRLKLREGNIENALIYYERPDIPGMRQADILLYKHNPDASLKEILVKVLGVKTVVEKTRRIYFIDNVKFHFDKIAGLGTFIEVEAIDRTGNCDMEELKEQCTFFAGFLGIGESDFINNSYSDMIMDL